MYKHTADEYVNIIIYSSETTPSSKSIDMDDKQKKKTTQNSRNISLKSAAKQYISSLLRKHKASYKTYILY